MYVLKVLPEGEKKPHPCDESTLWWLCVIVKLDTVSLEYSYHYKQKVIYSVHCYSHDIKE